MFKKIEELRSTEKGRALFKLILYMAFFVFVIVLVIVANAMGGPYPVLKNESREESRESTGVTQEKQEISYFEKQKKLSHGKYDFDYKVTGTEVVEFYGSYDDGYVDGFKETEDDLVRYKIENNVVYALKFGEKEVYEELYSGLDSQVFDLESLFTKLNGTSSKIKNEGGEKIYDYEISDGFIVEVFTDVESIKKIIIRKDDVTYQFNYKF